VSQPLTPNRSPSDAATTLAATRAAQPDLTNRKEIPLSSFDFLAGAYAATRRARRISIGVLVIVGLLGFLNVISGFRTGLTSSGVRADIREIASSRNALIAEFGEDAEGIPTEDVLERDRLISTGLASITAGQGDFGSLLTDLAAIKVEGAAVSSFVFGSSVVADEDSDFKVADNFIPVKVTVIGTNIASVVDMAELIRGISGLSGVKITREETTAVILAMVPANKPPSSTVERLLELGVQFRVASSSGSKSSTESDTPTEDSTPAANGTGNNTDTGSNAPTTTTGGEGE
jgi:hypothetical protein